MDLKRNSYYYSQHYGEYYRSYYSDVETPRKAVATAGPDELADSTQLIAQLVGGRNELADSMGAPSCVRGDL